MNIKVSGAKKYKMIAYDGTQIWRDETPADIMAKLFYKKQEKTDEERNEDDQEELDDEVDEYELENNK